MLEPIAEEAERALDLIAEEVLGERLAELGLEIGRAGLGREAGEHPVAVVHRHLRESGCMQRLDLRRLEKRLRVDQHTVAVPDDQLLGHHARRGRAWPSGRAQRVHRHQRERRRGEDERRLHPTVVCTLGEKSTDLLRI